MKVGYSKTMAWVFVGLGLLVLGLNLVAGGGRIDIIRIIPGAVCLLVGIGYLTKPYFFLETTELVVPAMIGPLKKRYPFEPGQLSVRDGAVWLGHKKLGVRRWLADNAAWDHMETRIQSGHTFD